MKRVSQIDPTKYFGLASEKQDRLEVFPSEGSTHFGANSQAMDNILSEEKRKLLCEISAKSDSRWDSKLLQKNGLEISTGDGGSRGRRMEIINLGANDRIDPSAVFSTAKLYKILVNCKLK
jgi:hypothetical protein